MADHLVSDGFKDAGYVYVNIDVSYFTERGWQKRVDREKGKKGRDKNECWREGHCRTAER